MMTEHLRKVVGQLATLPESEQDAYAEQIEADLQKRARIAAQLADPRETDLGHLLDQADREIAAGQVYDLDELLREP
ncbi:MAG: hypothetical protein IVW57_05630 [Ktedonobacterales bacterium]|nr:hypothetical protein [Ktedonobacterales bacterium]